MSGYDARDNQPLWKRLSGMSNSEWADFHAQFSALPLSEKFRGLSQIHDSWSNTRFERDDTRFSEAEHTAYTGLCRTLYAWTKIDQKPTHEADRQTALADAITRDDTLQDAARNWKSLGTQQKLDAMDRVQQLHARIYGMEKTARISVAPRYMNAGMGLDAYYDHDHMSPERCENKLFNDTLGHFGDAVQATLHGASMRYTEQQRMAWFGGSDDTDDPDALQGSMFHMDFFTGSDQWGHEDGEFQNYVARPRLSYARETAGAVLDGIQSKIADAAPTVTDAKREAVYRIGKIEEHLTDGRVIDRDRSLGKKIAAINAMPDEQIAALSTGLKAHILADLQHEASGYTHEDNPPDKQTQKQAFELGNRITRLTDLEPEFVEHQQKLEEHLVNRMRRDPEIAHARENWKKLSDDRRLAILDRAVTMHAEVFGYTKPVVALIHEEKHSTGSKVNGVHYGKSATHPDGLIQLNSFKGTSFHNFHSALNTAIHEATHAHQHDLASKFLNRGMDSGLNDAEKKQAHQFFWTTKGAFYTYVKNIGYENYKAQNIEKHAFTQGAAISARVAAKPALRERVDLIARRVQNFADRIGQKVSLVRPPRPQTALAGKAVP